VRLDAVVERAFKRMRDRKLAQDLRKLVGSGDASEPWAGWAWEMAKNLRARAATKVLLVLVLVLVVACGGRSDGAPDVNAPLECVEEPWTPEWCDARAAKQFVVVCEGGERGELGTDGVWSGAPYAACAPAELEPGVMAWCCWGRN
jgi:hypothetical protein